MRKQWYLFALVMFAFPLLRADCHAAAETKPLRVAMWGEYMPLHGFIGNRPIGLEAELAYTLAAYLKREVLFVNPTKKGMNSLDAVARGDADIAINAITPTPEREKLVGFTKPYLTVAYRLLSRSSAVADRQQLASRKVAAPAGPAFSALQAILREKAMSAPSLKAAIDLLKAGTVDYVFDEETALVSAARGIETGLFLSMPLGDAPFAIAVPKAEVQTYNKALNALQPVISELVKWWWNPGGAGNGKVLTMRDMPWGQVITEIVKEKSAQSIEGLGLDLPLSRAGRPVIECPPAWSGRAGLTCNEAMKQAQNAWRPAYPVLLKVAREDKSHFAHTVEDNALADDRNPRLGPWLCKGAPKLEESQEQNDMDGEERSAEPAGLDKPAEPAELDCRITVGSEWTAHTRTGLVRATVDRVQVERYESCGEPGNSIVAYFKVDPSEDVLFISSLPLRPGKSEFIPGHKQQVAEKDIPASVRRYFREQTAGYTETAWQAYRIPGSAGEAIAVVNAEEIDRHDREKRAVIAILHWTSSGAVKMLYRDDFWPNADGDCGPVRFDMEGFFDFDGDGDLDVLINNGNLPADGLSFILRVPGGYRPVKFPDHVACIC